MIYYVAKSCAPGAVVIKSDVAVVTTHQFSYYFNHICTALAYNQKYPTAINNLKFISLMFLCFITQYFDSIIENMNKIVLNVILCSNEKKM